MNPSGQIQKRFGNLLICLAFTGALTWIAWSNYFIVLWRTSPAVPDSTHRIELVYTSHTHFLTAGQSSFNSHFQTSGFIGAAAFPVLSIIGALILRRYDKDS